MTISLLLVGVGGLAGAELVRLVTRCPQFELKGVFSTQHAGRPLGGLVRVAGPAAELVVQPVAALPMVDVAESIALLATPAKASIELVPGLLERGARVLDLSGAYRLADPQTFEEVYGFVHPHPQLLALASYGVPELPGARGEASPLSDAKLVSNPGCYATASLFALAPLVAKDLVQGPLFVDGKSGLSGAGRTVAEKYMFTEVNENVSPYRVSNHQHAPEIEQALARLTSRSVPVSFTPHLVPLTRGLMTTCFGQARSGVTQHTLNSAFDEFYGDCPMVEGCSAGDVSIQRTVRSARVAVGAHCDEKRGAIVSIASIDNLLKGAASQALQNLAEMTGAKIQDEVWL